MSISKEDPRLTAYALGEIEDSKERAEIEAALAADPELQAEVDSVRALGDMLGAGFAREATPELSEFDKARMEQKADVEALATDRSWLRMHWKAVAGMAASILLAAVLLKPYVGSVRTVTYDDEVEFAEVQTVKQYRKLEVSIPPERMEGTPQPIKVPNLEPAPTQAPVLMVEEEVAVGRAVQSDPPAAPVPKPALVAHAAQQKHGAKRERTESLALVDAEFGNRADAFTVSSELGGTGGVQVKCATVEPEGSFNTEAYDPIETTSFRSPLVEPLSTFSIDVDTASYANVRRFLNQGQLPPADSVRIEELVNYFNYSDAAPTKSLEDGGAPFAVHLEQMSAPWQPEHRLVRVGLKGYEMPWEERPASNLVFLLDVSGSMSQPNKLPLLKEALMLLTRRLDSRDRVAIVVYAGASGLVLPSTTANNTATIEHALTQLQAGGSTNAGAGIELAYQVAREHFIEDGNNRVILCTDGDFNVGQTNRGDLAQIVADQAKDGVSLTVLGFGMGNYKDNMLEELSNKGKGTYAYVDSEAEARKVFLQDLASNIFKIAKDVKIQVEFNPSQVRAYRLIGYENRRLKSEDFNNDQKAAGDIGPGHTIVALYEIVPVDVEMSLPRVDELKYQQQTVVNGSRAELATVKLRYKLPDAEVSQLIVHPLAVDTLQAIEDASADLRFAAAVAAFGMRLRSEAELGDYSYEMVERLAAGALDSDPGGHRSEFIGLVRKADGLNQGN
ncbi:YfbK domain-containing protein [Coraliomargarita akajimensis]|uniref:von Willebrand factor type A n=1 Tax=Coraliomargarita akajimensis (strain DSM 45221 / IAM 15411 / JCM 23193 / KCTC 12865 / 04OKA010-24) TaxID=583355 RepID=D5EK55_CORAD|nr:von Willebrand factor type A domain-containing protein [Coraliomargarita akajimensis]ADE54804.1 von Willebrand factor type A [Coraliomargarita akajimensis DSM 45221]